MQEFLVAFLGAAYHLDIITDVGDDIGKDVVEHDDVLWLFIDSDVSDGDRPVLGCFIVASRKNDCA
jgi:hypothetical protein